ncbi:hypothetical protein L7F22_058259 [Adiantum nelumboides]|nr:hypothetical protein [Adiantum nelumboides]
MANSTRKLRREVLRKKTRRRENESSSAEEEKSDHSNQDVMDMTFNEASDESYKVPSHSVDPESSSETTSGNLSSPEVEPKNIKKKTQSVIHHAINRPTKSKSQAPFNLNSPTATSSCSERYIF